MKIDKRRRYFIQLDTETCNTLVDEKGKLDMSSCLVYDLGISVIDYKGRRYEDHSLIINEIFFGERELMKSAYYAEKLPQYFKDIAIGKRKVVRLFTARKLIKELMEKYDTNVVIAHNARFDYNSLNTTLRYLTKSQYRYFFPKGTEIWCTQKMARQVVCKSPMYRVFCETHGFFTKTGRLPQTAEVLYRYITNNPTFVESHTGLEDVQIEAVIFAYCVAKKQRMIKKLWAD